MMGDATALEQEIRLAACLRILLEECGERPPVLPSRPPVPAVRRARDYLHARYTQPVRLEQLAAVTGVSRFHLAHLFTRATGVPPHAYQNQLRIAAACRLLRAGVQPAHIDVGFADQSHLGRHFKRIVGVTPGEYAATVRRTKAGNPSAIARTF
jgi:AraC-like DNA-binding protein